MATPPDEVTELLVAWSRGTPEAADRLIPLVHAELRRIAARQLHRERREHTLSPTALVNEAYLRLVDQDRTSWENRAQFFGMAAQMMRRILVDYARARAADKRGGGATLVSLSELAGAPGQQMVTNILGVDEALGRLARQDPDQVRIIELRFFAGLSVEETAVVLKRSPRTIKREWRLARAWLYRELHGQG